MYATTISTKYQVVIPLEIRKQFEQEYLVRQSRNQNIFNH